MRPIATVAVTRGNTDPRSGWSLSRRRPAGRERHKGTAKTGTWNSRRSADGSYRGISAPLLLARPELRASVSTSVCCCTLLRLCISLTNAATDKDQSPAKGGEVDVSVFYCGNHKFMLTNKQTNKQRYSFSSKTLFFRFRADEVSPLSTSSWHRSRGRSAVMSSRSQWRPVRIFFLLSVDLTQENQEPHQRWRPRIPPRQTRWRQLGVFPWRRVGPYLVLSEKKRWI